MEHNPPFLSEEQSKLFSSKSEDNIAIVAAMNQKDEEEVKTIAIENIMAVIMQKYNLYLNEYHPDVVEDVLGIIDAMGLEISVADYIFDSVSEQGKNSEYWTLFQEIKSIVKPFTA